MKSMQGSRKWQTIRFRESQNGITLDTHTIILLNGKLAVRNVTQKLMKATRFALNADSA
uniref:Uncharacterized protein n=1 Tax=Myoviridae sp. ctiBE32 TaxID=2826685 RepID=A0A8S5N791_9CAUD|nr:MAG TPA: hypothetical protein [Myoviridae sp. ctiBE32]